MRRQYPLDVDPSDVDQTLITFLSFLNTIYQSERISIANFLFRKRFNVSHHRITNAEREKEECALPLFSQPILSLVIKTNVSTGCQQDVRKHYVGMSEYRIQKP